MGRGISNKTREKQAKATEKGILKARAEDAAKTFKNKKHFIVWLKKLLEENMKEVPKIAAILGLTWMIKFLVDWTQGVFKNALEKAVTMPFPFGFGQEWEGGALPFAIGDDTEIREWIMSYVCAYIIIEHGGEIAMGLGELGGSLTKIVGFLLG